MINSRTWKKIIMGKTRFLHVIIVLFLFLLTNANVDDNCVDKVTNVLKFQVVKDSIATAKTLFPKCRDTDEGNTMCGRGDRALAHINLALETLNELKIFMEGGGVVGNQICPECPKCPGPSAIGGNGPVDCTEIYQMGHNKSGVYSIYPKSHVKDSKLVKVYCDMDTDGGGWTVIQRRANFSGQTDFYQDWETYKKGFGDVAKDFWLGNDNIFTLTNQGAYSIRIDLKNNDGEYRFSKHENFWIGDEDSNYVLHLQNFTGNVTDNFSLQNKRMFSTKDRQNDGHASNDSCAVRHHGAWWWPSSKGCGHLNLNGVYLPCSDNPHSVWWWDWGRFRGLFFVEMKIRHRYAQLD